MQNLPSKNKQNIQKTSTTIIANHSSLVLSPSDFKKVSSLIYDTTGIKMPEVKRTMLSSRLTKRMKALNFASLKEYCDYLFTKEGKLHELKHMMDVVTTNKTDFFREVHHFQYMSAKLLPEYQKQLKPNNMMKVWSSACSSGEEPYTLAMTLDHFTNGGELFNYQVWATDLSQTVLQKAELAVYHHDRITDIPLAFRQAYLLKSKDKSNPTVRIAPHIRKKVMFQRLNLMDSYYEVGGNMLFDIIFCRNVLIYFDRETQEKVVKRLLQKLKPGGYFFLGHSESIVHMSLPLRQVYPTIFVKVDDEHN